MTPESPDATPRRRDTAHPADDEEQRLEMCAYRLGTTVAPSLVPAAVRREWMEQTPFPFATRCLPMMMANQTGWFILNSERVEVTWNGGASNKDMVVKYEEQPRGMHAISHFGLGIVTWRIPLLFRTPPDFDLWVRGPANMPKQHVYALEGIVETNWAVSTFTMNWQMLTPNVPVTFEVDEPIAMILPHRKYDLERFDPVTCPIAANPELHAAAKAWGEARSKFMGARDQAEYQLDYTRGRSVGDEAPIAENHRTRRHLRPFREKES